MGAGGLSIQILVIISIRLQINGRNEYELDFSMPSVRKRFRIDDGYHRYTLVLKHPQKTDSARYECRVKTELDEAVIATELTVRNERAQRRKQFLH